MAASEMIRINEPNVIHQVFDDEVVMVDLRSGNYFSLSDVGGEVLLAISSAGAPFNTVVDRLTLHYDAPREQIEADLTSFLALLRANDLVVMSLSEAAPALPSPGSVEKRVYAPPTFAAYNDLQDLFLLDPVHEVDENLGWPAAAGPVIASSEAQDANPFVTMVTRADVLSGQMDDTTLLVNRDNGLYCEVIGDSTWFPLLGKGVLKFSVPGLAGTLIEAGIARAVVESGDVPAATPIASEPKILLRHDLQDQIKPWQAVERPQRSPLHGQARELLEELEACRNEMVAHFGPMVRSLHRIGGLGVEVGTFSGQEAEALLESIRHLRVANSLTGSTDLRLCVWNCVSPPRSPALASLVTSLIEDWRFPCGPRGEVKALHCQDVSAIYNPGPDILSVVDFRSDRAWIMKLDQRPFPYWEIGSPFRFVLHEWLGRRGLQYVHGGAVGTEEGAVLLVGKGGSGKSTTSLRCVASGMKYVGDDYCLAECGSDSSVPWVHSLYSSGKLVDTSDFVRLPELRGQSLNPDSFERGGEGKGVFSVSRLWPDRVVTSLPLRALMIPRIHGGFDTTIEPCSRGHALMALLPSTVGQLPGCSQADCQRIQTLVSQTPAYFLHLGTDMEQIPDVLTRVIQP